MVSRVGLGREWVLGYLQGHSLASWLEGPKPNCRKEEGKLPGFHTRSELWSPEDLLQCDPHSQELKA